MAHTVEEAAMMAALGFSETAGHPAGVYWTRLVSGINYTVRESATTEVYIAYKNVGTVTDVREYVSLLHAATAIIAI